MCKFRERLSQTTLLYILEEIDKTGNTVTCKAYMTSNPSEFAARINRLNTLRLIDASVDWEDLFGIQKQIVRVRYYNYKLSKENQERILDSQTAKLIAFCVYLIVFFVLLFNLFQYPILFLLNLLGSPIVLLMIKSINMDLVTSRSLLPVKLRKFHRGVLAT